MAGSGARLSDRSPIEICPSTLPSDFDLLGNGSKAALALQAILRTTLSDPRISQDIPAIKGS